MKEFYKIITQTHREHPGNGFVGSIEDVTDGYHSFAELYEYRKLYNALLFNQWAELGKFNVHKSMRHSDGEMPFGGGYFIVVARLPTGQISNHYEIRDWDMFDVPEVKYAAPYDGHTPADVTNRIKKLIGDNTNNVF